MDDLNKVTSEYKAEAVSAIENNLILHWYPQRIVERFGHCKNLLELGIGHGFTAAIFNAATDHHTIVEGSSNVIDEFKRANSTLNIDLQYGYFESFEENKKYDVIIMGFVLEHVDNPAFILNHFKKFMELGCRLFIAVPNAKSLNRRLGLELGLIDDIYSLNANDRALGHKRQYCRDTLKAEVEALGYRIVYEEGIYLKPLPLDVLKTLKDFEANLQAMLHVGIEFPDLCVGLLMEIELL